MNTDHVSYKFSDEFVILDRFIFSCKSKQDNYLFIELYPQHLYNNLILTYFNLIYEKMNHLTESYSLNKDHEEKYDHYFRKQ